MLQRLKTTLADPDTRNAALMGVGMATLLTGARVPALAMFAIGSRNLEKSWRTRNNFSGTFKERWDKAATFYSNTHKDPTNRALHMAGIPLIVGGAAGLIAARPIGLTAPIWWASAGSFTAGWALNLVGHSKFEGNSPAFADDPLSVVVGPVWDMQQFMGAGGEEAPASPMAAAAK